VTVEGAVESANPKGIRVGGEWRNVSKFRPVELPPVGTPVRLELDDKGFIRELQVLEGESEKLSQRVIVSRDRTITRLAVLEAAAAFCALRPTCKSSDVLAVATSWLRWMDETD
jgi:hypothetical protein